MLNTLIVIRQCLFKFNDNKILKKYNKIWEKIGNLLNISFDSQPVYDDGDKYIKTKIKMYGDRMKTNFQGKKVPKENATLLLEQIKDFIHNRYWKSVNM